MASTPATLQDRQAWAQKAIRYIFENLLQWVIPDREERKKYISGTPSPAGIWLEALTDPTIIGSPNYERLEKLGDKVLDESLTQILMERFPGAEPGELDGLTSHYTSNLVFADMIKRLLPGIPALIRIVPEIEINDSVLADIFESLTGALYLIAETKVKGLGPRLATDLFAALLKAWLIETTGRYEFDRRYMAGDFKTQVLEIFTRNGVPSPAKTLTVSPNMETVTLEVRLGKLQVDFLVAHGRKVRPRTFTAMAVSKEAASRKVYSDFLDYLLENDITPEWAGQVKANSDVETLAKAEPGLVRDLKVAYREAGFERVEFRKVNKHTIEGFQTVMIMRGIRSDGSTADLSVGVDKANVVVGTAVANYLGVAPPSSRRRTAPRSVEQEFL